MRRHLDTHYDAVIVGARVAGAATALLLARAGLRVLVVERSAARSDTTSTHALMRAGVMQLRRWGVLERIAAAGTPAIRKTTFHYGDEAIEVAIKDRDGVGALYAPRRFVLDAELAQAAAESGAHVRFGTAFTGVLRDAQSRVCGVRVVDGLGVVRRVEAGLVIGADGARSSVARAVGAAVQHEGQHAGAVLYGYWRGLDLDGTHWHYGHGVAAGAIPTNDGEACVFAALRPARYEVRRGTGADALFGEVLAETSPRLAQAVSRATRTGNLHPFAGRPGFIRQSFGPGWALVGDAGCFKDPITAHGMTDALRDAELLAAAAVRGTDADLAAYQAERDTFAVQFLELSDAVASLDWDFDQVKVLHFRLSKLMNLECDRVRTFGTDLRMVPAGADGGTPGRMAS